MSFPEPPKPPRNPDETPSSDRRNPPDGFLDEEVIESLVNYTPAGAEPQGGLLDFPESEPGVSSPATELRDAAISLGQSVSGAEAPRAGGDGDEAVSAEDDLAALAGKLSLGKADPPKPPGASPPPPVPTVPPVFEEVEPGAVTGPKVFVPRPLPPKPARPAGIPRAAAQGTPKPPPRPAPQTGQAGPAVRPEPVVAGKEPVEKKTEVARREDRPVVRGDRPVVREEPPPGASPLPPPLRPVPVAAHPPPLPSTSGVGGVAGAAGTGTVPAPGGTPPVFVRASDAVRPAMPAPDSPFLVVGGVLALLGIAFACRIPVQFLGGAKLAGNDSPEALWELGELGVRGCMYAFAAVAALVIGLGALSGRRWSPAVMHAAGWVAASGAIAWLAAGFAGYAGGGPDALAQINGPAVATAALLGLGIPLAMILAGQRPQAVAACAAADSRPQWTDRAPAPVLMVFAAGIAVACGTMSLLPLAPQLPRIAPALSGGAHSAILIAAAACGLAVAILARLRHRTAWWLLLSVAIALPAGAAAVLSGSPDTPPVSPVQAVLAGAPLWVVLLMSWRSFHSSLSNLPRGQSDHAA